MKSEKSKDIFPINEKPHEMDLRNSEKYAVRYAHTERFKKSAIPYMQRLLNEEYLNNQ